MKVLIIEDQFEIADMYRKTLNEQNIICDISQNAQNGLSKLQNSKYDLLLLDMNLPDMFGTKVLKELKKTQSTIGIIIITASNENNLLIESLNNGADDYLTKPINLNELIARVNAVYRRYNTISFDEIQIENISINPQKQLVLINDTELNLTQKEYLLFFKLVENYPGYIDKQNLISAIYDEYYVEDSSAIRVHIYNLKRKLKAFDISIINEKNKGYKLCLKQ